MAGVLFVTVVSLGGNNRGRRLEHRRPQAAIRAPSPPAPRPQPFAWPLYGYSPDHQRHLAVDLRPPYRGVWGFNSHGLLEFPPVIYQGAIYQLNDSAVLNALDQETGQLRWSRKLGALSASSPAAGNGAVYVTLMDRGGGDGLIAALAASDGHTLWKRKLPSASESSPLLHGQTVYFGSQDGTVYALRAADGKVRWRYTAAGSVKGSPTYRAGRLFFGDYGQQVHAISASSGRPLWTASGSDSFYATATVAWGRVFVGDTSGTVYAFSMRDGHQVWSHGTGNSVYASAAALDAPGLGKTIYLGSYDGSFYALDAGTGDVRWSHAAGGRISGSATIVGHIVYFANLAAQETTGLDVRTGRRVFRFRHGSFDPVTSDGRRIYLTGSIGLYALQPSAPRATGPSPVLGARLP
ncbi:MAG: hypothetical protein NVS2B6_08380 [Thermoleophilaceae bacterium]